MNVLPGILTLQEAQIKIVRYRNSRKDMKMKVYIILQKQNVYSKFDHVETCMAGAEPQVVAVCEIHICTARRGQHGSCEDPQTLRPSRFHTSRGG